MKDDLPLGDLIMIGLKGPTLSSTEASFIEKVQPAGVIYFRRNVKTPSQLARLSDRVRSLYPRNKPPLIGIDQEGGRVVRLREPFTVFPPAQSLGHYYKEKKKLDLLKAFVRAQITELRTIGVNYNFFPLADVDTNPRNPIIGDRSFFPEAKVVAKLVKATVQEYRSQRFISCAKHFPGHGDTFTDSHKVLPRVKTSKTTILRRELLPFRAAISAGVPTIMTAHIVYNNLDSKRPATLSPKILQDLLRKRLKYKGVIVSDDLEMAAIARHASIPEVSLRAIQAGVDLLLVCKSLSLAKSVHHRLQKALRDGELRHERVVESLERLRRMRLWYLGGQTNRHKITAKISHDGWVRHQKLAQEIEKFDRK